MGPNPVFGKRWSTKYIGCKWLTVLLIFKIILRLNSVVNLRKKTQIFPKNKAVHLKEKSQKFPEINVVNLQEKKLAHL